MTTNPEPEPEPDESSLVLVGLRETLVTLNTTMHSLIDRLDVVGQSNDEIAKWRQRATRGFQALSVVAGLWVLTLSILGYGVWRDGIERDEAAERERVELAAASETRRLEACRSRNEVQRSGRDRFVRVFDTLEGLGVEPSAVAALRASLRTAVDEDVDCNADDRLDERDYLAVVE